MERMFPARPAMPEALASGPSPNDSPLKQLIEPIYAEGQIKLTNANLAKFGPFAFLYNAANLFHNDRTAEGNGNVRFPTSKRGALTIQQLRYFNRGTEIRAVATLDKIWALPNSPLCGSGFITARPLSDVKLPFLSDFDSVLVAVQSSLADRRPCPGHAAQIQNDRPAGRDGHGGTNSAACWSAT